MIPVLCRIHFKHIAPQTRMANLSISRTVPECSIDWLHVLRLDADH